MDFEKTLHRFQSFMYSFPWILLKPWESQKIPPRVNALEVLWGGWWWLLLPVGGAGAGELGAVWANLHLAQIQSLPYTPSTSQPQEDAHCVCTQTGVRTQSGKEWPSAFQQLLFRKISPLGQAG